MVHTSPFPFRTIHSVNKQPSTSSRFDQRFHSGERWMVSLTSGVNETSCNTSPMAVGGMTWPPVICAICSSSGRLHSVFIISMLPTRCTLIVACAFSASSASRQQLADRFAASRDFVGARRQVVERAEVSAGHLLVGRQVDA